MMLKLKSPFFIIFLSILFFGCQHELNFPGNGQSGSAVFSFDGASGICTHAIVTGSYKTGTALGITNVVSIAVNVAVAGTYTISTGTINGIRFTAVGTFTATGPQAISLTGSGIPVSAGTFSFTPSPNGCSFPVIISSDIIGSAIFTYDGAPGPCTNISIGGKYTAGNVLTASNRLVIDVNVIKTGNYSIKTDMVNGISFSGSGIFTTLGYNIVTLIGTGIPTVSGIFVYAPSNNGCPFPIHVNVTEFLKCTIDGIDRTFNSNLLSILTDPTSFSISGFETSAANSRRFDLEIVKSPVITTGSYNQNSGTNPNNYCVGIYNDGVTTTEWNIGQAGQPVGFSVIVTSYTANRIEGTFSGTLYSDNGNGNDPKVITNGQFSLPY